MDVDDSSVRATEQFNVAQLEAELRRRCQDDVGHTIVVASLMPTPSEGATGSGGAKAPDHQGGATWTTPEAAVAATNANHPGAANAGSPGSSPVPYQPLATVVSAGMIPSSARAQPGHREGQLQTATAVLLLSCAMATGYVGRDAAQPALPTALIAARGYTSANKVGNVPPKEIDPRLAISDMDRQVMYCGVGIKTTDGVDMADDSGTLYADVAVDRSVPLYYYEVEIVQAGTDAAIGIGLADGAVWDVDIMPGWHINTYGYHGDDGHKVRAAPPESYQEGGANAHDSRSTARQRPLRTHSTLLRPAARRRSGRLDPSSAPATSSAAALWATAPTISFSRGTAPT